MRVSTIKKSAKTTPVTKLAPKSAKSVIPVIADVDMKEVSNDDEPIVRRKRKSNITDEDEGE